MSITNTKKTVSEAVIKRLPRYYRCLLNLEHLGMNKVSSKNLAEMLDITASQVRQDFCCFGGFGQQGYGYVVPKLREALGEILGLNSNYNLIIVGGGNIGRALANYRGFKNDGFNINAVFDINPDAIHIDGIPVFGMESLSDYLKNNPTDIAIIATQRIAAQSVCNTLVELGIRSIWNFAPVKLEAPQDVVVENINMIESLFVLTYRMTNKTTES